jgi:hypothetical protein
MTKWCAVALVAMATVVSIVAEAADTNEPIPVRPVAATRVRSGEESQQRLREGSRLTDVAGQFDFAGDRIAFFPSQNKDSFRVLENLALERVSRILGESRDKPEWSVSGIITEFRGVNYLLVTKAIIKPAPETTVTP